MNKFEGLKASLVTALGVLVLMIVTIFMVADHDKRTIIMMFLLGLFWLILEVFGLLLVFPRPINWMGLISRKELRKVGLYLVLSMSALAIVSTYIISQLLKLRR